MLFVCLCWCALDTTHARSGCGITFTASACIMPYTSQGSLILFILQIYSGSSGNETVEDDEAVELCPGGVGLSCSARAARSPRPPALHCSSENDRCTDNSVTILPHHVEKFFILTSVFGLDMFKQLGAGDEV